MGWPSLCVDAPLLCNGQPLSAAAALAPDALSRHPQQMDAWLGWPPQPILRWMHASCALGACSACEAGGTLRAASPVRGSCEV